MERRKIPETWTLSIICPIYKKGNVMNCKNHRGISLLNMSYKILSNILLSRLRPYGEEIQAYDSIVREELWIAMYNLGVPIKLIRLIKSCLQNSKCKIKANGYISKEFEVKTGLRQGDALSLILFKITLESVEFTGWRKTLRSHQLPDGEADVLVVSESNRAHPSEADGWFSEATETSAVTVLRQLPRNRVGPSVPGFRWVEFPGIRLCSCYWSPNSIIAEFTDFLLRLEIIIRSSPTLAVVCAGDFNAKSREWGSPREDRRGTLLADFISALDATICNDGHRLTFVRGELETYIDVTFASANISGAVRNWTVREDVSLSVHRFITFHVRIAFTTNVCPRNGQHPVPHTSPAVAQAEELVGWLTRVTDKLLPKQKEIQANASQKHEEVWKEKRKLLAIEIKEAKDKFWADIIATVDDDPLSKPYKIVTKRLRRQCPITGIHLPGRIEAIVNALFPTAPTVHTPKEPNLDGGQLVPFSIDAFKAAAKSLPNQKAPGPDGLSNEIIKVAVSTDPTASMRAFNACLESGQFPQH
ncbi:uncharacterized protein LOC103311988 [Acyrthosiphon pisum]|uniref:Endonuclease/exonuclease/phosphatase domain-containing protein n=1 Tax=Acyrthosiphon pisum TaxID=7029 RepID=A0A8R2BBN4_ACYPI|nr:uncharacterized protein LOC103311988 [Acyrthosiphon pisum]|eukprot:XP_008190142.1 PREDICTED: uncharacterized protein LOC103311988 [Acyrthosiphon pisum]